MAGLGIKLLIEVMQSVDIPFSLRRYRPELEPDGTVTHALLEFANTLHANILKGVLKASLEILNELGDRTAIQYGATVPSMLESR